MVSLRSLVAGAALMAAPIMAALTPAQIVDGTNSLTEKSRALLGPAESINLVNSPLIVIGQGPFPVRLTPALAWGPSLLTSCRHSSPASSTSSPLPPP